MNEVGGPIPILNVTNVAASIAYYVGALGFKNDWEWGEPPSFASVSRGKMHIFFCQGGQGHAGTWMWVPVENVDALYEEFRANGATTRQPPTNFPWGSRELNVEDIDGHRIRFASDATGASDGTPLAED